MQYKLRLKACTIAAFSSMLWYSFIEDRYCFCKETHTIPKNNFSFQALAPDNEAFRLGINKCHKTINDTVSDEQIFRVPGAQILFRLLATASEMHSGGPQKYGKRRAGMSFKGLLTNVFQQNKAGNIADMAKAAVKESAGVGGADIDKDIASKLKAVELIFGAAKPEFDAKVEHEKATASARTKAQKLLGIIKAQTT